jgi:dTDP-4-amino-4,6-dideoxygalactose transaminase
VAGPGHAFLGEEEAQLVQEVLSSWELGRYRFDDSPGRESKVYTLEREVERRFGSSYCLALNSGTSALITALAALGVGPGDEVIVPGYTFIASIAAIVHCGAVPVLAEIDESLTLDPADVERRITPATRAIMAVHMLGAPCDMDALTSIADDHGLFLVEDVAQACGASYHGRTLGTIGDAGAFSLNIYKVITAGEGGWLTMADEKTYERAFAYHDHGFRPFRQGVAEADSLFGQNLRMNELTGAIALGQLRKIDKILGLLQQQKAMFSAAIGTIPGVTRRRLNDPAGECSTLLVVIFDDAATAAQVADRLGTKTILASGRHHYANMPPLLSRRTPSQVSCPYRCAAHPTTRRYEPGMLPRTDDLLSRSIALSVGVVDSYLGSSFGINVRSSQDEIAETATLFRDAAWAAESVPTGENHCS